MRSLLNALPLAGCAVMTWACARRMNRGGCRPTPEARASELAQLRAEVARLSADLGQPAVGGRPEPKPIAPGGAQ